MFWRRLLVFCFSFIGLIWFKSTPVFSQSEFVTDYTVEYTVNQSGSTHARITIDLINQLSNIYAKEFTLSIGSTRLSHVKAYSQSGNLEAEVVQGNKTTNINLVFPEKILGKDKGQNFTLEFDSADFSQRLGHVWEISIPRLSKSENLRHYQLTLNIPQSFGLPATIIPAPVSQTSSGQWTSYRFNSEDLFSRGISATFGQVQYFDFRLYYHLQNQNVFPVKTEIALPPDTSYQTLIYETLDPSPLDLEVDQDGNWLARYQLAAKETLTVLATGSAEIFLQPKSLFSSLTDSELSPYLEEKKYWEISSPKLKKLAQELQTPKNIYQYLVDNLIYDYGRLSDSTERLGAANTLDNQNSAICMEFTDLFVALSRAGGIPSRAVNGYAYTTNPNLRPLSLKQDVLHAWPEYYDRDKKLWVPVDPTWGNTTGGVDFFSSTDLNHFSFVILGADSQYPIPAGAYKTSQNQNQDVQVEFGSPRSRRSQLELELDLPDKSFSGVTLKGFLRIKNSGNVALYQQTVKLQADSVKLNQDSWLIPVILPLATLSLPFELGPTGWNQNVVVSVQAQTELAQTFHQLHLVPAYQLILTSPYFFLSLALLLGTALFLLIRVWRRRV